MTSQPKNRSEDISGLVKALAAAQGEIKDIARNRTVKVATRQGSEYSFKYATLSAIIDGIREPLSKHGIAYTQTIEVDPNQGFYVLTTTLHWENQWMASVTPIILSGSGSNQEFGSALTYMKRYALAAIVGVSPDEDDDGNLADGNQVQAMQETSKSPAPPAPNPLSPPSVGGPEASFSPDTILTTTEPVNWMDWGKTFMDMARKAPSNAALETLMKNNEVTLEAMHAGGPKLYANLIKAINNLNPGAPA